MPMVFASGLVAGAVLLVCSAASFVASGYLAVGEVPLPAGVPEPKMGVRLSARAAVDEVAVFGIVLSTRPQAVGRRAARIGREIDEALEVFGENGWLDDPASYQRKPPPGEKFDHRRQPHKGWKLKHTSFESGYEPRGRTSRVGGAGSPTSRTVRPTRCSCATPGGRARGWCASTASGTARPTRAPTSSSRSTCTGSSA